MLKEKNCEHLESLVKIDSKVYECQECVENGSSWVHLRTCQSCGITLCCDSSPNQHASKHYKSHGHPVIISAEPRESWAYCYEHQQLKMNIS